MIPVLYDKTGANKIGDLIDSIECYVEEERNGIFELTMVYPANTTLLDSICYENIIVVDANDYLKNQKFRIYNTRKLMSNRIEICARHISFDLAHDWIDALSINNQPCEYVLNMIFKNSQFSSHFKGHSDIVNAQDYAINETTCLSAIGGAEGSIIDTFGTGAEILRDNTDIHVLNRRGSDNDVSIEYRKNLTGLEVEEDTTDLVTRILPYATYTNDNSEEIKVKGAFIDSPLINNYAHPYVKYIDYSGEFDEDNLPTASKLESLAKKEYINNKVDIPKMNYKIEFIPLSKCAGYEGLEDKINLCDTVTIRDTRYGIDTQSKVIKVTYDALRDRYESMELGEPRTTLGDIIGGTGESTQGPPGPQGPQGPAGADGSIGDFPSTLPEVPTITTKVYGFANVEVSWTFENKVYYSYELYASKTKGFVPNTFNLIFEGQASTFLHQVNPNETWYYRACAINSHGSRTEFSDEVKVSTVKITDLSNYVESAAIGDALIGELNLGRGWVGELKGNYIDAKQLSVTDGNGKRTLDIDSFGNVKLDVASLKINSDSVATNVSVAESYYNKEEFKNSGLYNLLKNGGFEDNTNHWQRTGSFTDGYDQWKPYGGGNSWVLWGDANCGLYQFFNCRIGQTYSWSLDVFVEKGFLRAGVEGVSENWYYADNDWVKMSGTFVAKSTTHAFIIYSAANNSAIHFDNAMVNEGAIPQPYQPNFLEVNDNINTLTQRISSAEQKITPDAIINTVKQSVYTKTETENAITSKGYATSAEVQQTAQNIEYKFTQSGGFNLIRNGGFENQATHWSRNGSFEDDWDQWSPYGTGTSWVIWANANCGFYQFFDCRIGQTYSWSLDVYVEHGYFKAGVEGVSENWYYADNGWVKMHGTFKATNSSHAFILYAVNDGTTAHFDNVMVCEGTLPSAYTPHPSEVYDGITTIDRDGITVNSTNVNTTSTMSADGFKITQTSTGKELFNATNGNLTMQGTLATGTSGKYIKVSDSNYKVFNGSTQVAFLGLASNDIWTDSPKLIMGITGTPQSASNAPFAISHYKPNENPSSFGDFYTDISQYVRSRNDHSNIKLFGDGNIRIAPVNRLTITSNTSHMEYAGTGENFVGEFGTSGSPFYNGFLDIGAVINYNRNGNGLVLEHNRDGTWCAVRVNVDSSHNRYFRPMEAENNIYLGSSGFKWHSVWAANGSVQTSDIRYKMKMGQLNTSDCFEMVKNTDIYKYCMLPKSKEDMTEIEVKKMAKTASNEDVAIQTGIMAQDILDYECAKYILTHDVWVDEETQTEKEMYNINPYAFSASIMAALQFEIQKREELEQKVVKLEKQLTYLKELINELNN